MIDSKNKILIKLSGESFKGNVLEFVDANIIKNIAYQISELYKKGFKIGIVIGGGNILRGRASSIYEINQEESDYVGMQATLINSSLFTLILKSYNVDVKHYSNIPINNSWGNIEKFDAQKLKSDFDNNKTIIISGGTGEPNCSTDLATANNAVILDVDIILMTKLGVEGVYDKDPRLTNDAVFYESISYDEMIEKELKVIDIDALEIFKKNNKSIIVFNMNVENSLLKVMTDKNFKKTIISNKE